MSLAVNPAPTGTKKPFSPVVNIHSYDHICCKLGFT
jgi:hypothetical protein